MLLASLVCEPDVDVENDADDSTSDDVKKTKFNVMTIVFKPLEAEEIGVENITSVTDVPGATE